MEIKEIREYLNKRLDARGSSNYYIYLEGVSDDLVIQKLNNLYRKNWFYSVLDNAIKGDDPNSGILYFNLVYKIVRDLEREGKI